MRHYVGLLGEIAGLEHDACPGLNKATNVTVSLRNRFWVLLYSKIKL